MRIFKYLLFALLLLTGTKVNAQCWSRSYTPLAADFSGNVTPIYQLGLISFIDDSIGWVAGIDYSPYKVGLCKTLDGGKTWKAQDVGKYAKDFEPYGLAFSDRDTGWLGGHEKEILYTIDGGDTWNLMVDITKYWSDVNNGIDEIFLQNGRTAWFFDKVSNDGILFYTNNFGKTWNVKPAGFNGSSLFINEKGIGWADRNAGKLDTETLEKTTDNGQSWEPTSNPKGRSRKISFHGNYGTSFNDLQTKIIITNDFGDHWETVRILPDSIVLDRKGFLSAVDKIDSDEIIISGYDIINTPNSRTFKPYILKSYDNGKTWHPQKLEKTSPYRLNNVKYITRNFAVAVGDSNQVYIYRRPAAPICDLKLLSSDTLQSNELLTWAPASGCIGGYYISIGTAPNKKDILDSLDLQDVLSYNLSGIVTKQNIFVALTPYNDGGSAPACAAKKIYLQQCTLLTRLDTMIKPGTPINDVLYLKDTVLSSTYKSAQGCDSIVNLYVDVLTSTIDLPEELVQAISVAPNPTSANLQITFQLKSATTGSLYLTDRLGRILWKTDRREWPVGAQSVPIDVSHYPSGVYQVHWRSASGLSVVCWVKQD